MLYTGLLNILVFGSGVAGAGQGVAGRYIWRVYFIFFLYLSGIYRNLHFELRFPDVEFLAAKLLYSSVECGGGGGTGDKRCFKSSQER